MAREAARRPGVLVEVRAGVRDVLGFRAGVLVELLVGVFVPTLDAIISIWRSIFSVIIVDNFSPMLPIMLPSCVAIILPSFSVMILPMDSIMTVTSASVKVLGASVTSGGSITLIPRLETSRTLSDRFCG